MTNERTTTLTDDLRADALPKPEAHARSSEFDPAAFAAALRELKGELTVRDAAALLCVSPSFLAKAITGRITAQPSLRTMQRLLSANMPNSLRQRLIQVSGYKAESFSRVEKVRQEPRQASPAPQIVSSLNGNLFAASALVMDALTRNGASSELAVNYFPSYYTITDRNDGREFVCINVKHDSNIPVMNLLFFAAYALGVVTQTFDAHNRSVIITTDDRELYGLMQQLRFSDLPMPALLALTDGRRITEEIPLKGTCTFSLLDPGSKVQLHAALQQAIPENPLQAIAIPH